MKASRGKGLGDDSLALLELSALRFLQNVMLMVESFQEHGT